MFSQILNPITRISFGLVSLAVSLILLSTLLGIFPDSNHASAERRELIAESIAVHFSAMSTTLSESDLSTSFIAMVDRYDEIASIAVRQSNGELLLDVGNHQGNWQTNVGAHSTPDQVSVPIYAEGTDWGQLEFRFVPLKTGIAAFLQRPEVMLAVFFGLVGFVTFYLYLRFVLRQLDPSRVVPRRVRDALDTLGEGLIVVNKDQRIVLANSAFQKIAGKDEAELVGEDASEVAQEAMRLETDNLETPWEQSLEGHSIRGRMLTGQRDGIRAAFMVSSSPIVDDKGKNRGAIASFEDVTQLARKKAELETMLIELDASSSEIKRQNRELEILATRDPMTGCLNRRAFFELFDKLFENAQQHELPIAGFMVDIDHFKAINDNYGHAKGDEVLTGVAKLLRYAVREKDIVCRYGGEEFAVLLPNTTIHQACVVAEQIRSGLKKLTPAGVSVTTSIGVSALCQGPESPEDLLDQADKCLYVAKRNGRNQIVRWDDTPDEVVESESKISRSSSHPTEQRNRIPFHAVTALISALAYRDQETANHCRRVADLCVAAAEGLISAKDCYVLEIAGLLHDIGKIGVADAILLKDSKLTKEERLIMQKHERIGVELIHTSFNNDQLDQVITNYRVTYQEQTKNNLRVPIAARLLAIADAFDSMTNDKLYRKAMTKKEAFKELRNCSGTQFDPELVEQFIQVVKAENPLSEMSEAKVSKQAALSIGLQIERLAEALDSRDKEGIGTIASRLTETATQHGISIVADKATEITREIEHDGQLYDLLRCTVELMDLCRNAQKSLVDTSSDSVGHGS